MYVQLCFRGWKSLPTKIRMTSKKAFSFNKQNKISLDLCSNIGLANRADKEIIMFSKTLHCIVIFEQTFSFFFCNNMISCQKEQQSSKVMERHQLIKFARQTAGGWF